MTTATTPVDSVIAGAYSPGEWFYVSCRVAYDCPNRPQPLAGPTAPAVSIVGLKTTGVAPHSATEVGLHDIAFTRLECIF